MLCRGLTLSRAEPFLRAVLSQALPKGHEPILAPLELGTGRRKGRALPALLHKQTLQLSQGKINDFRRLGRINESIQA